MTKEEFLKELFRQYNEGIIDGQTYDYQVAHIDDWDLEEE